MADDEQEKREYVAPEELSPHPLNAEVYGDVSDLDESFVKNIRDKGVLQTVIVDTERTIISGHRRVAAARAVGIDKIEVEVQEFESDLDRRADLVDYNKQRNKKFSQQMREAEVLKKVERERARERQGERTDLVENQPQGDADTAETDADYGKTRDKVGEEVGIGSGRTFSKAKKVWDAKEDGDTVAQHQVELLDRDEQSVHGAYRQVKERLKNDTEETEAEAQVESESAVKETDETLDSDELVKSAHEGTNDKVFPKVIDLHVDEGATVADVTYGNGTFWKRVPSGKYDLQATDIDPKKSPSSSEGVDCRDLPYQDSELDCVVLDPPYAEGFYDGDRSADESTHWIKSRYSGGTDGDLTYHEAVLELYFQAGQEASRVLKNYGILIVKVQDEVSRNEQRLTHIEVTNYYEEELGLKAKDLFVVVRPDTPVSPNIKRQRRARKNHSYFLVFEK